MPQGQPINSSQTDGRASQFQRRWEPIYHWRSMCSMLLGTPGLRAAWPMSVVDYQNPQCTDISGHGYHLTNNVGGVVFGHDLAGIVPIARFLGAANQYLSRADGGAGSEFDILGNEAYIIGAQRGMTLGGWFWWAAQPGAIEFMMAKDDGGANRQYYIIVDAANNVIFRVWAGPIAVTSTGIVRAGWNHCVGVYDSTNQDLHVVLNGVVTTNAGAAPAVLADTAAPFTIGANGAGANRMTGYASDCILSAVFLQLGFVKALYHYTKAAYGVK